MLFRIRGRIGRQRPPGGAPRGTSESTPRRSPGSRGGSIVISRSALQVRWLAALGGIVALSVVLALAGGAGGGGTGFVSPPGPDTPPGTENQPPRAPAPPLR